MALDQHLKSERKPSELELHGLVKVYIQKQFRSNHPTPNEKNRKRGRADSEGRKERKKKKGGKKKKKRGGGGGGGRRKGIKQNH